nr:MAG TPA: hypothetical protein [Bacteriophage sp.]
MSVFIRYSNNIRFQKVYAGTGCRVNTRSVWQRQIKYSYVSGSLYKLLGVGDS